MAKDTPGRGSDQFPLRFPDGMRDQLKKAAKENNRSLNAEIIARLELASSYETERIKIVLERDHYKQREQDLFIQTNILNEEIKKLKSVLVNKEKELSRLKDFDKDFRSYVKQSLSEKLLLRRSIADIYLSSADLIDQILSKYETEGNIDLPMLENLGKRFRNGVKWLLDDIKKTENMFLNDQND